MIGPRLIPTDEMILEGSKYLFKQSSITVDEYIAIDDYVEREIVPKEYPTHVAVLGTPWVWDMCWTSPKYKNTINLFHKYPFAKRLFLGIGSCLPLGKGDMIKDSLLDSHNHLKSLFEGSTVITRDTYAHEILSDFGSILLPCPAFYAIDKNAPKSNAFETMFWYEPNDGISKVDYGPTSKLIVPYLDKFKNEYEDKKPVVYCITETEVDTARLLGLGKAGVIKDVETAKFIIQHSRAIFSGRVHLAVPAYRLGKRVELVAVDSRAKVLYDVVNGLIKHPDLAEYDYINLLKDWAL